MGKGTHQQNKAPESKSASTTTAGLVKDEAIRIRAYELYEQRGRAQGHDVEDWLQAEQEVAATDAPSFVQSAAAA